MEKIRNFIKNRNNQNNSTNIPTDGLETIDEYKERWRSIRIIYFTMFLMSLGFSIVLTGLWPFLDSVSEQKTIFNSLSITKNLLHLL